MSGDACARDDRRGSCSGGLAQLQLLKAIRELGKGLGEGIWECAGLGMCFGQSRVPLSVVLVLANIPAGKFRIHLLRIALFDGDVTLVSAAS